MKSNPVGWFELYVQDMNRARAFYEHVFQGKLDKLPSTDLEMWTFPMDMTTTGSPGALVKMEDMPPAQGLNTLVYFSCADCAVEAARAVEAGGKIEKPKFSIGPYGFIALVIDSEGIMIGLHSLE